MGAPQSHPSAQDTMTGSQDPPDARGKRPAYQFYPGDEERDSSLRVVGLAAFGLWHRMLNLMHFANPRGHLATSGGKPIDVPTLAKLVGESTAVIARHLDALESEGVFSRTPSGVIYCRRMVQDEHIRTVRAEAGRLGGEAGLLKQTSEQTGEQTAEQKPPPAVAAAAAAAAASSGTIKSGKADAESESRRDRWRCVDAATAAAPPACWSDLEGNRLRLLVECYGDSPPKVQRDKGEQMRALVSPSGVQWGRRKNAQRVHAGSVERLERKCAETLDEVHRLRDPKAAMAYLIRKVADTSDDAMPGQLAERETERERQREDVASDADYAIAESWASGHPDVIRGFENSCKREGWSGIVAQHMRRAHVLTAWRKKGSPSAAMTTAAHSANGRAESR